MLDRPKKTLSVGKEAIDELDSVLRAYFASDPFERIIEVDHEAGLESLKFVKRREFPQSIVERKATEALLSIKYAFDQLAWAACNQAVGHIDERDTIYFPWADTYAGFKKRIRGKSSKIPPKLWAAFLRTKPYGTGESYLTKDDICRQMSKIANRKHSVGIDLLTVPSRFTIKGFMLEAGPQVTIPHPDFGKPVKDEITVLQGGIGSRFGDDAKIHFYVAFDKTTPLKGKNVLDCLRAFSQKAQRSVEIFEGRL